MDAPVEVPVEDRTCGYCGRVFPSEVRYHSGVRECGSCWNWRKMDGPMCRYWLDTLKAFAEDIEEPLNIDLWDAETVERMGMSAEWAQAIQTLRVYRDRLEIAINTKPHTAEHRAALGYAEA